MPGYSKEDQLSRRKVKKKTRIPKVSRSQALHIRESNAFLRERWDALPPVCEECDRYLGDEFDGRCISHIVSGSLSRKLYLDPRNVNKLCRQCHDTWEYGNKKQMRIYKSNIKIILELRASGY